MHYPDLSEGEHIIVKRLPKVRNIGWLQNGYQYPKGEVSHTLIEKLDAIISSGKCRAIQHKGYHACDFCTDGDASPTKLGWDFFSSSVLWLPSPEGIIYAMPTLVKHYIAAHQYQPPQDFLAAVEAFDLAGDWDGYLAYTALIALIANYNHNPEAIILSGIAWHRLKHSREDGTGLSNQPDYLDHPERKALYDKIMGYQKQFGV